MSRFVRASKYRHVFGQPAKKEHWLENIKVTNSAWDTNIVSASGKYITVNWNSSGGGAFAILPLPSPFTAITTSSGGPFTHKLPDTLPLARSHTAAVLDTDWSPHSDSIVASGAEDGKVMIWKVDDRVFDGWGEEGWEPPRDFDPVARIDAGPKKIGQVVWHPTAAHVLASASGEHTVKVWDLTNGDGQTRAVLGGHGDTIQSVAFNVVGTMLATTCRDRKLRMFDLRAGGDAVRTSDGHGGVKGARVVWMGEHDRIATTGFSRMSDRQVGIWETGGLGNLKLLTLDQSSGVVMPFWSDNNILFLGESDGNVRYYEYELDTLHALSEYKSTEPQRGMCFLPRRSLNVSDCEIARAYKVHATAIEPIAFIVPRKADSFQSDIFPPALSSEASLTAAEFFSGKPATVKLVNLESGSVFQATPTTPATAPPPPALPSTPAVVTTTSSSLLAPVKTPTRSMTAPEQQIEQIQAHPVLARSQSSGVAATSGRAAIPPTAGEGEEIEQPDDTEDANIGNHPRIPELEDENTKLTGELRDAREKIRNLELQVEGLKANARKAAQALLDSQV
ncbi:hypothetical protein M378DRAFT_167650 [Amanita muscaria Koide BX008]|uniref:Coronin n=1 Tax=Amanita muscaria (strain Koide BX008) TaxID=946122 RepID=A0A0C2T2X3_AMAMK|nr:hypothetical protein M378DRAFT_167650 [Amanita muscaria Koide BX008]